MKTEYIIKKDDMRIKIVIEFFIGLLNNRVSYRVSDIQLLPKRKRKWQSLEGITDRYDYRYADTETKKKIWQEECYKYVTEQDIRTALNMAYEKLKPEFSLDIFSLK